MKLLFNVLFSDPGIDDASVVSLPGDRIVRSMRLQNGEAVWLQTRETAVQPAERKAIEETAAEYEGFGVSGDLGSIDPWALAVGTSPEGIPIVMQFQLGRKHFTNSGWSGG